VKGITERVVNTSFWEIALTGEEVVSKFIQWLATSTSGSGSKVDGEAELAAKHQAKVCRWETLVMTAAGSTEKRFTGVPIKKHREVGANMIGGIGRERSELLAFECTHQVTGKGSQIKMTKQMGSSIINVPKALIGKKQGSQCPQGREKWERRLGPVGK
jgi:hypothetical protein